MTKILYHYVHCPFCLRVRMTAGLLGISYESKVLPYDDEETPIKLIGKKMLPVMDIDGKVMPESLDIMMELDQENQLKINDFLKSAEYPFFDALLKQLSGLVHPMAMPCWIYTPEFNDASRAYFQNKKESSKGPFKELVKHRHEYERSLLTLLSQIKLNPFYESDHMTVKDILLASQIWGMYIVPEFQFSEKTHSYLQSVKELCNFNYHEDFWK